MKSFLTPLFFILCFLSGSYISYGNVINNPSMTDKESIPIASLLHEDGTLNLNTTISGNINLTGYNIKMDECRGGVATPDEAFFAPSEWSALGSGINIRCRSIAIDGSGDVYAGGNLTIAGGISAKRIAKWDGTTWSALGTGLNSYCNALAIDGSGNVYAGGEFTTAGGVTTNHIAKWDGTTWSALGTGLDDECRSIGVDGSGNVYAGGEFAAAGGVTTNHIAKWDGTTWSSLGTGLSHAAYAIAIDGGGNVYAGGGFLTAGGVSVMRIAKWDGTTWSALGSGLSNRCDGIAVDGSGNIYAGGGFTTAGGITTNYIAKWDGMNWSTLGTGLSGWSYTVAINGSGDVYAGGDFTTAGGVSASKIAKWDAPMCAGTNTIPTAEGTYTSNNSITDGGWKHYCDADEKLLLSLDIGASGAVIADDEVQLNIGATTTSTYTQYCGGASPGCFIDVPDGGTVFNRSWDVNPTTQPSAGNVGVKFYYTQTEYDAVDAAITGGLTGMDEMWFYKVTNGETFPTISSLEASEVLILTNDATTPAIDKWVMGTKVASSEYYAEYLVSSFSGGGGGGSAGGLAPLPVELIYFHVYAEGEHAKLKWSTASETNNRGFEIQHSIDGEDWSNLGFMDGLGNSTTVTDYNFTHEEPRVGINYYRLKQIDLDGKVEFLPIKNIHFASNKNEPISIYPNPAKDFLNITNVKGQGKIYNSSGQLVMEVDLKEDGINIINVNELGLGVFHLVVIKANGERVIKRFMK